MPLSTAQNTITNDPKRFRVAVCGRRFGKTHLALRELAYHARQPEALCWYVAPTYRMAKQIMWKKLKKKLIQLGWAAKINESDLSVTLVNGSEICLRSADNPDSLRGVGLSFVTLDEAADMSSEVWYEVLRPTLPSKAEFINYSQDTGKFLTPPLQPRNFHVVVGNKIYQLSTNLETKYINQILIKDLIFSARSGQRIYSLSGSFARLLSKGIIIFLRPSSFS